MKKPRVQRGFDYWKRCFNKDQHCFKPNPVLFTDFYFRYFVFAGDIGVNRRNHK